MAVNKNFVVKNGLEVGSRLIVADAQDLHVGLGTTAPLTTLDVRGDVRFADDGATVNTVDIAGITTFRKDVVIGVGATVAKFDIDSGNLGIHSSSPRFALDIKAGVGDTLAASFDSDIFAPNLIVSGGSINYIVAIAATIGTLGVTGIATANQLAVSGVTTLGTVQISSGIVTATTGIVTYYGDGSYLTGAAPSLNAAIGISSNTSFIGAGVTLIDFGSSGTTITTPSAGISTVVTPTGVSLGLVIALGS
jgi:hypothetical protein